MASPDSPCWHGLKLCGIRYSPIDSQICSHRCALTSPKSCAATKAPGIFHGMFPPNRLPLFSYRLCPATSSSSPRWAQRQWMEFQPPSRHCGRRPSTGAVALPGRSNRYLMTLVRSPVETDRAAHRVDPEASRRAPPETPVGDPPVGSSAHADGRKLGVNRAVRSACVHKDRRPTGQSNGDCPVSVPDDGLATWVQAAVEVDRAVLGLHERVPA